MFKLYDGVLSGPQLKTAMNLNIITGAGAAMWYAVCFPGNLLNVFFANYLGASSYDLGLLTAIVQLSAIFNLLSIVIYAHAKTRKFPWFWFNIIHRSFGFVLAGAALFAAQGGDKGIVTKIILAGMAINWALAVVSTTGWWTWQTDLYTDKIRATFFGRRSAILALVSIGWFFLLVVLLDLLHQINIFYLYAAFFTVATVAGILDIIFHATIPEPRSPDPIVLNKSTFFEPLRCVNFRQLVLGIGLWSFSAAISMPFVAPYITSPQGIGAPNTWLGIMFASTLIGWTIAIRIWGRIMDRFGRKGVVLIGGVSALLWLGYLFVTPQNYYFILPVVALLNGLAGPMLILEGGNQLMLSITPGHNKLIYIAWYATLVGLISSGGSLLGGKIKDLLADLQFPLGSVITLNGFHCIILLSVLLCMLCLPFMARISEEACSSPREILRWMAFRIRERLPFVQ